jgi:hypothetical protein
MARLPKSNACVSVGPPHLNTLETAAYGANRMHNQAVNQRSFSALGPCAGKPSRWDIT